MKIHQNLPAPEYHALPQLGSTDLKNMLRSPLHFLAGREHGKRSKALELGSAVHDYILENSSFFSRYAVEPEGLLNKAKNPWKADWDKFKVENSDKTIVTRDDWKVIKGISKAVHEHPWASRLLQTSKSEVSVIGEHTKGRADLINTRFISDVKTCEDIRWFYQDAKRYRYDVQSALYLDLFREADGQDRQFIWIACEKTEPYGCKVFLAGENTIEKGRESYKKALERYLDCLEKNVWPGYETDIEELDFS